jgi:hypothetical protein
MELQAQRPMTALTRLHSRTSERLTNTLGNLTLGLAMLVLVGGLTTVVQARLAITEPAAVRLEGLVVTPRAVYTQGEWSRLVAQRAMPSAG